MGKTNIKNTSFTPLFHNVLDQFGITAAAVFGRVWQYCQMERGFCHAEQETIAYQLGINRKTVNIALATLVQNGYLSDVTPNTKGRTRIYKDTGKAGGKVYEGITLPVTESVTEVVTLPVTEPVTKSNTNINNKEKKKSTPTTQAKSSVVEDELKSLNDIQREAYNLARQVTSHEIALSKAMSETPMESAIGLLEWHSENRTANARTANALLYKIREAENREESIARYEDNYENVFYAFKKLVDEYYVEISNDEIRNLWIEYIELCQKIYEGDKYDMFANGQYNRNGLDDRSHYERLELYVKQSAARQDKELDELERAEKSVSYV